MILGICDNVSVLRVFRIIRIIIVAIKIIVPIVLLVSAAMTFTKAVTTGENKKAMKAVTNKIISALLVFLIPTFIGIISNLSSGEYFEAFKCIKNSTDENISRLSIKYAKELVETAKITLQRTDLASARSAVSDITDEKEYNKYTNELNEIEKKITEAEIASWEAITAADATREETGWWWPVGSSSTTTENGKVFAKGEPATTRITATFGGNDSVHKGLGGGHGAIDIGASRGTNVIATRGGVVKSPKKGARIDYPDQAIRPDANGKYNCKGLIGNEVIIDHGDGFTTRYAHLYKNTITVRAGERVEQGQVIGKSGSSGCSTGPHLHFQVEKNGKRVDPLKYVSGKNPRK